MVLIATLYNKDGSMIHRNFFISKEWKHMNLADPGLKFTLSGEASNDVITLTAERPAFFVDVYYPGITFSERGFILLPGEKKKLKIIKGNKRISGENIRIFSLNNYLEH